MAKITFKTVGGVNKIEIDKTDCSYHDALDAFERMHGASLRAMDLYVGGKKVRDLDDSVGEDAEITAVQSKYPSAARG